MADVTNDPPQPTTIEFIYPPIINFATATVNDLLPSPVTVRITRGQDLDPHYWPYNFSVGIGLVTPITYLPVHAFCNLITTQPTMHLDGNQLDSVLMDWPYLCVNRPGTYHLVVHCVYNGRIQVRKISEGTITIYNPPTQKTENVGEAGIYLPPAA